MKLQDNITWIHLLASMLKRCQLSSIQSSIFFLLSIMLSLYICTVYPRVAGFNHPISKILNYPNSHERNHSSDTSKAHSNYDHCTWQSTSLQWKSCRWLIIPSKHNRRRFYASWAVVKSSITCFWAYQCQMIEHYLGLMNSFLFLSILLSRQGQSSAALKSEVCSVL
jgi:hypothetical protein